MDNYQYILVVDDNAGIRHLLCEVLLEEGYNVEMAQNGIEAIQKTQDKKPSLILLDARMPGMSGLEAIAILKKIAPNVPVIIISAYTDLDKVIELSKNGLVHYYLKKPFDLNQVRELVKGLLIRSENLVCSHEYKTTS